MKIAHCDRCNVRGDSTQQPLYEVRIEKGFMEPERELDLCYCCLQEFLKWLCGGRKEE